MVKWLKFFKCRSNNGYIDSFFKCFFVSVEHKSNKAFIFLISIDILWSRLVQLAFVPGGVSLRSIDSHCTKRTYD